MGDNWLHEGEEPLLNMVTRFTLNELVSKDIYTRFAEFEPDGKSKNYILRVTDPKSPFSAYEELFVTQDKTIWQTYLDQVDRYMQHLRKAYGK